MTSYVFLLFAIGQSAASDGDATNLTKSVTFYASFDQTLRGDIGNGQITPSTRYDRPNEKGTYDIEKGFPAHAFRIAKSRGIQGGALEGTDVLPNRGRIFFPAKGNLPFKPDGWSGSISVWLKTNPNTMLKTPYCDPVQITEKRAGDGGLWIDFPNTKPRDFRLGAFRALAPGEKPAKESNPDAPLIRIKEIGFKFDDWHHVAMTWQNFDSGKANASASLFIDGKKIGSLEKRDIAMRWDLERTGIYVAVNYIGLLDELAIFDRSLTDSEIHQLRDNPSLLAKILDR